MISERTKTQWDEMLMTCYEYRDELNGWERQFIDDIGKVRERGFDLSYKQSKALRSTYRKVIGKG